MLWSGCRRRHDYLLDCCARQGAGASSNTKIGEVSESQSKGYHSQKEHIEGLQHPVGIPRSVILRIEDNGGAWKRMKG